MARDPAEHARRLAAKIERDVRNAAGAGVAAALQFFRGRLIETISISANPIRRTDRSGNLYYVAGTPATKGAPIRKLSGRAIQSVTTEMISETEGVLGMSAVSPKGFRYPAYHEIEQPNRSGSGKHKFIAPTVARYKKDLATIIGGKVKVVIEG